ncbi:MAG: DNA-binding domain-containing protein, partial [Pseudomonadota bacterium]
PKSRHTAIAASLKLSAQDATPLPGIHDGQGRPASDRFSVYRNNVLVSLRDALRATFSATRRLAGEAFFDAAATAYAERHKPNSPIMFRYGDGFPAFLASLPGLAAYKFVPEVASLEFQRVASYHAADSAPLNGNALATIAPDALPAHVFNPHPATCVLSLPNGGLAAWQANTDEEREPTPAPAALITRPAFDVIVTPLEASAAAFATDLLAGRPLGEAAAREGVDVGATLGLLLAAGAFSA